MKPRNGKIAKLPENIREELNSRLRKDECGVHLVQWLNSLPEVHAVLAQHFQGRPLKPQNLYEWKEGGYAHWLNQKLMLEASPPDENAASKLKELRNLCRTLVLDTLREHLAWYQRGYADGLADASGE